jgi:hypothetical protein
VAKESEEKGGGERPAEDRAIVEAEVEAGGIG